MIAHGHNHKRRSGFRSFQMQDKRPRFLKIRTQAMMMFFGQISQSLKFGHFSKGYEKMGVFKPSDIRKCNSLDRFQLCAVSSSKWKAYIRNVSVLSLLYCGAAFGDGVSPESIAHALGGDSFTWSGKSAGVLHMASTAFNCSIVDFGECERDRIMYECLLVRFPDAEAAAFKAVANAESAEAARPHAQLISIPKDDKQRTYVTIFDEQILKLELKAGSIGPYLDTEKEHLRLEFGVVYLGEERGTTVTATELAFFDVPTLVKRFQAARVRRLQSEGGIQDAFQEITVSTPTAAESAILTVKDQLSGVLKIFTAKELEQKPYVEPVWHIDQTKSSAQHPTLGEIKGVCVNVVDGKGRAVKDATVHVRRGLLGPLPLTEKSEDISGKTDLNGRFCFKTGISTGLTVRVPGMYDVVMHWAAWESVPNTISVVVSPADTEVQIRKGSCFASWLHIIDHCDAGLDFDLADTLNSVKMHEPSPDTEIDFHIYPEDNATSATPQGIPQTWVVEIKPRLGWSIQAAGTNDPATMKVAPAEGYVDSLRYTTQTLPTAFYVREDIGPRYGKLYEVGLEFIYDEIHKEANLRLSYEMQAHAETTRSLNPKKRTGRGAKD